MRLDRRGSNYLFKKRRTALEQGAAAAQPVVIERGFHSARPGYQALGNSAGMRPMSLPLHSADDDNAEAYSGARRDSHDADGITIHRTDYSPSPASSRRPGSPLVNSTFDRRAPWLRRGGDEDESSTGCTCGNCEVGRACTHTWFGMLCCCFLLWSSLPRLSTVSDVVVTLVLYLVHVREDQGDESMGAFISDDFRHYRFRSSALSVVFLSVIRSGILFFTYSYRFSNQPSSLYVSTSVMVFSTVYVGIKLLVQDNSAIVPLLLFSLLLGIGQYIIYILVRRRKIKLPEGGMKGLLSFSTRETYGRLAEDHANDADDRHLVRGDTSSDAEPLNSARDRPARTAPAMSADLGVEPETLAQPYSLFMKLGALNIHYRLSRGSGAEQSRAIVLLHGFGGSVYSWKRAWNGVTQLGLPVLAFDRPGFGLTSRPVAGEWVENPYTDGFQCHLLFRLAAELGFNQLLLVGHSAGGSVAAQAAILSPEKVLGLFLISPTIYTDGFPRLVRSLFSTRLGKEIVKQLVRTEMGEVAIRRAWFRKDIPVDILANYKETLTVKNWDAALVEMTNVKPVAVEKQLGNIQCPVLILHGVEDKIVDISESKNVLELLHGTDDRDLVPIAECGHVPHEETAEAFVRYLRKFLESRVLREDT